MLMIIYNKYTNMQSYKYINFTYNVVTSKHIWKKSNISFCVFIKGTLLEIRVLISLHWRYVSELISFTITVRSFWFFSYRDSDLILSLGLYSI